MAITNDIFVSSTRPKGDLAGVFEHDGETGYFYLYATGEEAKVLRALPVMVGPYPLEPADLEVRWAIDGTVVGLLISGTVWAVFDTATRAEYGGDFSAGIEPVLPDRISRALRVA